MNNSEKFDINRLHEEAFEIDKKAKEMMAEGKVKNMQEAIDLLQIAEEQALIHDTTTEKNDLSDELRSSTLSLLQKYQIRPEKWGIGGTKTIDHLLKEIAEGETVLEVEPSGELIRRLVIATIDVYYIDEITGKRLKLNENKQVFKDGRERVRNLKVSLAEKLKAEEQPNEEMVGRALGEELGVSGNLQISAGDVTEETVESPSYPDLMTKTKVYRFSVTLNKNQYNPEGYSEHQTDKDTYFAWQEVNDESLKMENPETTKNIPNQFNIGSHKFQREEVGYEERENENFFIKTISDQLEVIETIKSQWQYVRDIFLDMPHIVPPMKIIKFEKDGNKVFAEYTAKIPFRGFFTSSTMYKSEDFCNFIVKQENLKKEILNLINDIKEVLKGKEGFNVFPEITTYGNMGIDYSNHIRIVDYDLLNVFNDTNKEKHDALSDFGYELLMLCLNYEYFFDTKDQDVTNVNADGGVKILQDPLYRKHLFNKFKINITPEKIGDFLIELNDKVNGSYVNLISVLNTEI